MPSGKEESAGAGGLPFPYAQAHVHQQPPVQRGRSQGRAGAAGPCRCQYHDEHLRPRHKGGQAYLRPTAG